MAKRAPLQRYADAFRGQPLSARNEHKWRRLLKASLLPMLKEAERQTTADEDRRLLRLSRLPARNNTTRARGFSRSERRRRTAILCRLGEKLRHHIEAFVRVVNDDVLTVDGSKAIAAHVAYAFGKTRIKGTKVQVRAIVDDKLLDIGNADHAIIDDHVGVADLQIRSHQCPQTVRHFSIDPEADDAAAPPAFESNTCCRSVLANVGLVLGYRSKVEEFLEPQGVRASQLRIAGLTASQLEAPSFTAASVSHAEVVIGAADHAAELESVHGQSGVDVPLQLGVRRFEHLDEIIDDEDDTDGEDGDGEDTDTDAEGEDPGTVVHKTSEDPGLVCE